MLAALGIGTRGATGFDFSFSSGGFAEHEIFDSATSPPGRYVIELGRRALKADPTADHVVIGNPLLPLNAARLTDWSRGLGGLAIGTDASGEFPLFYVLPRRLLEETERFLLALSTVSVLADKLLLSLLADAEVSQRRTDLPPPNAGKQFVIGGRSWILPVYQRNEALKLQCANTIRLIQNNPRWRDAPVANFHPYHAGDVLFWSVASRDVQTPLYQRHIVCSSYLDIARAAGSALDIVKLPMPWLSRDNRTHKANETLYFYRALERLGPDVTDETVVIFTRFLRHYSATPFHLIDQARFSLGDSMASVARTVQTIRTAPEARSAVPTSPLRVLLHLSGAGWTLKDYPARQALILCQALQALGCEVTVLDLPAMERTGARSIVCEDAPSLAAAIRAHHIFAGVDSFPHHFARHVMGWPTIGLFSNTKPCNSDAAGGPSYRSLVNLLPCAPCGGEDVCPARTGPICDNHAEPPTIIAAILAMARDVYQAA